jgi:hypothetical protein
VIGMALTRDFKPTVVERVQRDPAFARAMLGEAATLFLSDEPRTARLVLRDLVNATLGFEGLAAATAMPAKSLHRMLADGQPQHGQSLRHLRRGPQGASRGDRSAHRRSGVSLIRRARLARSGEHERRVAVDTNLLRRRRAQQHRARITEASQTEG